MGLFDRFKKNRQEPKAEEKKIEKKIEEVKAEEKKAEEKIEEVKTEIKAEIKPEVKPEVKSEPAKAEEKPAEAPKAEEPKTEEAPKQEEQKKGFFGKLKERLTRTHDNLSVKVDDLVENAGEVDDDFFEELTDILIMADVGMKTTDMVIDELKAKCEADKSITPKKARELLKEILVRIMSAEPMRLASPTVLFIIGVNGVGKTTSIGKLASRFKVMGRRVIIVAGDTFRAAAAEQLCVWSERAGVPIIKQHEGADPAAVVFDGIQAAKQKQADILIVDTAGRLHNKAHLMEELKKMTRVVGHEYPEANTKALLVIDATTGQNGLNQALAFKDVTDLEGIVLTKLDGTAKGGIAVAIRSELGLPVRYIGVGEQLDDMQGFDAKEFIDAIL